MAELLIVHALSYMHVLHVYSVLYDTIRFGLQLTASLIRIRDKQKI